MNEIPVTLESLKALYGEQFFLLEGELNAETIDREAQTSSPQSNAETAVEEKEEIQTAPNVEAKVDSGIKDRPKTEQEAPTSKVNPGIEWKVKPTSKVLFVIRNDEWTDKALLEFLKKIVASLEFPTEWAGFGLITGPVNAWEFEQMPQENAIVFDAHLIAFNENPQQYGSREAFFSSRLGLLQDDVQGKRELWNYLKLLKEKFN